MELGAASEDETVAFFLDRPLVVPQEHDLVDLLPDRFPAVDDDCVGGEGELYGQPLS